MKLVLFLLLIVSGSSLSENLIGDWKSNLQNSLAKYNKTIQEPSELDNFLSGLILPQLIKKWQASTEKQFGQSPLCEVCEIMVSTVIKARRENVGDDVVFELFVKICKWLALESENACNKHVEININIWLYAIDNKPNISPRSFCAYALNKYHCQDPDRKNWTVNLPPKPASHYEVNLETITRSPLKILHLTDIHYDPNYEPGSSIHCNLHLCCQKGVNAKNAEDQAGYWGSYPCDSPWQTVENVLTEVIERHGTFDAIYFTGDIIKHSEWLTSVSSNTKEMLKVYDKLKEVFKGLPLFPILGNHEPFPGHQFSPDGIDVESGLSTQWLYDLVEKSWKTLLPDEALQTVLKGGYYTILINKGLRLIALNSNVCFTYNHWLFYDDKDPHGQLQWMVGVLEKAEKNGEKVHVLSHVPSNDRECFFNWAREYTRIVERFSHVIVGQFNGHTHDEDIVLYFNSQNRKEAINVAFVGGSVTTFKNLNPNYKIFDVDPDTYNILNYETWTFNLTEANLNPKNQPGWYKLYDFKSAFAVSSLHPSDIADLVGRMTTDSGLLQKYYKFQKRESYPSVKTGCNKECEIRILCYIVTSWYGDDVNCDHYTDLYNTNKLLS